MLSAEKTKSAETNHSAWLDKKENLTLLTEATKSHQAELEKQWDDTKENYGANAESSRMNIKNGRTIPKQNYGTNADSSMMNLKNDRTRIKKNY